MLLSHFLFIFSQRYATILLDYYRRLYYVIKPFPLYFQPTLCHYFIDYYKRLYYVIKPFPLYFQPTLCHYFIRLLQETLLCY